MTPRRPQVRTIAATESVASIRTTEFLHCSAARSRQCRGRALLFPRRQPAVFLAADHGPTRGRATWRGGTELGVVCELDAARRKAGQRGSARFDQQRAVQHAGELEVSSLRRRLSPRDAPVRSCGRRSCARCSSRSQSSRVASPTCCTHARTHARMQPSTYRCCHNLHGSLVKLMPAAIRGTKGE